MREKGEARAVKAEVAAGEARPCGRCSRRVVRRPSNGPSSELGRCGAVCEPVRGRGRRPVREAGPHAVAGQRWVGCRVGQHGRGKEKWNWADS